MKKGFLLLVSVFILAGAAFAQTRNPSPTPTPIDPRVRQANELNRRSEALRNTENHPVQVTTNAKLIRENVKPLYRKPNKTERAVLKVDQGHMQANAAFLKGKKTGILKLFADNGCSANTEVIKASPKCAKFTMPGAGSAYSFRAGTYRLIRLADINFKKNTFQALGVLTHGLMTNLGDVDIGSVALNSDGVDFVAKFKPAKSMKKAAEIANNLSKGIKNGDRVYGSVLPVKANNTYVLRSIAYRGEAVRVVGGFPYNELEFDKRRDVIVAFRVVEHVPGEHLTIIWKQLSSKKAPKIGQ